MLTRGLEKYLCDYTLKGQCYTQMVLGVAHIAGWSKMVVGGSVKQKEGGMPCGIAGQAAGAGQPVDQKRLHMNGWMNTLCTMQC